MRGPKKSRSYPDRGRPSRPCQVLMTHPSAAHAVAFAMPQKRRGEEVAAAVVLRPGQTAGEHELRDFVAARLAALKVPRKIVFVDEIPKGATGKLERAELVQRLGFEG